MYVGRLLRFTGRSVLYRAFFANEPRLLLIYWFLSGALEGSLSQGSEVNFLDFVFPGRVLGT